LWCVVWCVVRGVCLCGVVWCGVCVCCVVCVVWCVWCGVCVACFVCMCVVCGVCECVTTAQRPHVLVTRPQTPFMMAPKRSPSRFGSQQSHHNLPNGPDNLIAPSVQPSMGLGCRYLRWLQQFLQQRISTYHHRDCRLRERLAYPLPLFLFWRRCT